MSVVEQNSRKTSNGKVLSDGETKSYPCSGRNSTDEVAAALRRIGSGLHFSRGQTIFNQGDSANSLFKLVKGAARLCKHTAGGRRQIADFVLPEEFFGFVRVGEHKLSAEAITDVTLVSYPARQIERLADEVPAVRKVLLDFLSGRVLGMQDHLVMLGRQTATERAASFLLQLLDRNPPGRGKVIDLAMSRLDIADYLGLTLETVSRTLADLKHGRVIDLKGPHRVLVRDVDALRRLAEDEAPFPD
jgi:CRP-like cAMP-binding protein